MISDGAEFKINGASGNLSGSPITIAPGGSYNVSVTYSPTQTGLAHGIIQIKSDDATNPVVTAGVDGLGAKNTTVGAWGNNYIAIAFPNMGDIATIRTVSDANGHFNVYLPPDEPYTISVFDPLTGLIAKGSGVTGLPGHEHRHHESTGLQGEHRARHRWRRPAGRHRVRDRQQHQQKRQQQRRH